MLMHHLLPGRRFQQIEAAILAAAALAAHRRNDILHRIDANRIARLLLYPTYEISLSNYLAALVAALIRDGITEHNHIATIEKIAVNPIHYHPVASFQFGGRPPAGTVKTVKAKVRTTHTRSSDKPKAIRNLTAIFKSIFAFLISKTSVT